MVKEEKRKERKILDRKPKEIPGMNEEIIEKEKNRKTTSEMLADWDKEDELEEKLVKKLRREKRLKEFTETKLREEMAASAAEKDYGWCDEIELPTIDATFNENEDITAEKTNRKVIK